MVDNKHLHSQSLQISIDIYFNRHLHWIFYHSLAVLYIKLSTCIIMEDDEVDFLKDQG
jgi:hypothetical protein